MIQGNRTGTWKMSFVFHGFFNLGVMCQLWTFLPDVFSAAVLVSRVKMSLQVGTVDRSHSYWSLTEVYTGPGFLNGSSLLIMFAKCDGILKRHLWHKCSLTWRVFAVCRAYEILWKPFLPADRFIPVRDETRCVGVAVLICCSKVGLNTSKKLQPSNLLYWGRYNSSLNDNTARSLVQITQNL